MVGAAATSGGDGGARVRAREREQRRGGPRGRVRGFERFGTTLGRSPTRPGARRQAGGGVAPRARVRCPASAYWQRLGMIGTRPVGWAVHWAGQVSSLSLSNNNLFCFSIFVILF